MNKRKIRLQIIAVLFFAVFLQVGALFALVYEKNGLDFVLTFGGIIFSIVAAVSLLANND